MERGRIQKKGPNKKRFSGPTEASHRRQSAPRTGQALRVHLTISQDCTDRHRVHIGRLAALGQRRWDQLPAQDTILKEQEPPASGEPEVGDRLSPLPPSPPRGDLEWNTDAFHPRFPSLSPSSSQDLSILDAYPTPPDGFLQGTPVGDDPQRRNDTRDDDEDEADGDEPRYYCFCNQVSYGEMVGCDAEGCPREWFHLQCVGLEVAPRGKGELLSQIQQVEAVANMTIQLNGTVRIARRGCGLVRESLFSH